MQNKILEKTIYLNRDLARRIEEVISTSPGLNFTVIINQALEEWLRSPRSTNLNRDCFITDAHKGFGPTSEDFTFAVESRKCIK